MVRDKQGSRIECAMRGVMGRRAWPSCFGVGHQRRAGYSKGFLGRLGGLLKFCTVTSFRQGSEHGFSPGQFKLTEPNTASRVVIPRRSKSDVLRFRGIAKPRLGCFVKVVAHTIEIFCK